MRWKGRPQSAAIVDLNDQMAALIHEEMLNYTNQGVRRYIPMPWVEEQIKAIQQYPFGGMGSPRDERYHSPGGYLRRYGSSKDVMITSGPNGEIIENPHFDKPLVPHNNPEQRRNKAHDSE